MRLMTDEIELINLEIMKRVFKPVRDDLPDPAVNFNACVEAMADRVRGQIKTVPRHERHDWFIDRALGMVGWMETNQAPDYLVERASAWAIRLLKERPVRH